MTGLSGSGKSTLAVNLDRTLFSRGFRSFVLDGDNLRHTLCADLGFSPQDRSENIRRVAQVARLFCDAGVVCITAFISPFKKDRKQAREIIAESRFVELYVDTPLPVCEQRDPKGLYAKARDGRIQDFTGVSSPYEPPENPSLKINTQQSTIDESIEQILDHMQSRKFLPNPRTEQPTTRTMTPQYGEDNGPKGSSQG